MSSDAPDLPESMTEWVGNASSRQAITTILIEDPLPGVYFVVGPDGVGKCSYLKGLLVSSYSEDDYIIRDNTRDSLREAQGFFRESSLSGRPKVVVVTDLEKANYASQDSWLLTAEELPRDSFLFFVISDEGALVDALQSRIRTRFIFNALNDTQMREFANQYGDVDEFALTQSSGIPSLYLKIRDNRHYLTMVNAVRESILRKKNLLLDSLPVLCVEAKDDPEIRRAISHILRNLSSELMSMSNPECLIPVLKFAATIRRSASCDVELHWWRMSSDISLST